jgi:hypothetical protein
MASSFGPDPCGLCLSNTYGIDPLPAASVSILQATKFPACMMHLYIPGCPYLPRSVLTELIKATSEPGPLQGLLKTSSILTCMGGPVP